MLLGFWVWGNGASGFRAGTDQNGCVTADLTRRRRSTIWKHMHAWTSMTQASESRSKETAKLDVKRSLNNLSQDLAGNWVDAWRGTEDT